MFVGHQSSVKLRLTVTVAMQRAAALTSLRLTCHLGYSQRGPDALRLLFCMAATAPLTKVNATANTFDMTTLFA